jgi:hypothetical protein
MIFSQATQSHIPEDDIPHINGWLYSRGILFHTYFKTYCVETIDFCSVVSQIQCLIL